jgi:primosomal protein N''
MPESLIILRVAVPSPLYRTFDYLPPKDIEGLRLSPGQRVRVPFGRTESVGLVLELAKTSECPRERLKRAHEILDAEPLLPADVFHLVRWVSAYYHHPPGEVVTASLPALLRAGHRPKASRTQRWRLTQNGLKADPNTLPRAPHQRILLGTLQAHPEGASSEQLAHLKRGWQRAARALVARGWIEVIEPAAPVQPAAPGHLAAPLQAATPVSSVASAQSVALAQPDAPAQPVPLNPAQRTAIAAVNDALNGYRAFLLEGVTGSGKTEVYLGCIEQVLRMQRQTMVLVPEIGLTPQLVARFRERFPVPIAVLHSGLSDRERLGAWLAAREGSMPIVIGTRSAIFTPLWAPGLFIVDEEHDPSLKQQDGLRYSARDLAVLRARNCKVPVLLGSATPSLESLYNAQRGRYTRLELPERAGSAGHPTFEVLDVRGRPIQAGLSDALLQRMDEHLAQDGQVLLFLNRRGFAPTVMCHACGWFAQCLRCDARVTLHKASHRLRCHHCGQEKTVPRQCPSCATDELRALGQGTERVEGTLRTRFPGIGIERIDRDSTRRKGAIQGMLERAWGGASRILIGTQMLAKGHHFPEVTLVGILDADQGLFSVDFRASERMAQLILQVSGRAGRAAKPGRVVIQTHHPDHPLLRLLVTEGYRGFSASALDERRAADLPPFASLALLRAEAVERDAPGAFLGEARAVALHSLCRGVELFGPVPAPMERRAGRYRAQLLLQARARADLHHLLSTWVPGLQTLKTARRVRWSLDVDPLDMQ